MDTPHKPTTAKIIDYEVVANNYKDNFVAEVKKLLKQGYTPYNGLCFIPTQNKESYSLDAGKFVQVMVKYEDST